jgi:hypothetical protein
MNSEHVTDCGHECCDDRHNPFHDHFLDPEDCCALDREAADGT